MNKILLNFAPTGMVPMKKHSPHVPLSVSEVVEDVLMASEMGIAIAHIHARDQKNGLPTNDPAVYARTIEGIRKYSPDLILCVSLSGRVDPDPEKRCEVLSLNGNLKPDMGSLTLSSLNFSGGASINSPQTISHLARRMLDVGVKPELEIFDVGMANAWHQLAKNELIKPPFYFNVILGNMYGAQATLVHAGLLYTELSHHGTVSFGGIGAAQLTTNTLAIATGAHVRVGLEDNLWLDSNRNRLATNDALLKRVIDLCDIHERVPMNVAEARQLLGLGDGNGSYGSLSMV